MTWSRARRGIQRVRSSERSLEICRWALRRTSPCCGVEKGNFGFIDTVGARMKGTQKLVCELTLRDGKVVYDLNGLTREDWNKGEGAPLKRGGR